VIPCDCCVFRLGFKSHIRVKKSVDFWLISLIPQTYENIEIIVVDDHSTDGTEDLVKEIMAQDDRIVYVRNEKNMGTYASRNVGMKMARGSYVTTHDGDDYSLPWRIEEQVGENALSPTFWCGEKILIFVIIFVSVYCNDSVVVVCRAV